MNKALFLFISSLLFVCAMPAGAQQVGIKTNILYWATTTPNLGAEVALGRKLTIDLTGSYNPWRFGSREDNKKLQHWLVRPEVRFWPYEKWDGHFLGVHGLLGSYNAGGIDLPFPPLNHLRESRYEGYAAGGGFSYGYQWFLGTHWNLEVTAGLGYTYLNYERYECRRCGDRLGKSHKHWVGPTNLGVSVIYLFKSKRN